MPDMDPAPRSTSRRLPLIGALCALVLLAGIVESPLFSFYRVAGSSMLPSFQDGDRVLVTSVPSVAGGIRPGDVVIAEVQHEVLIKRVVGVPGDVLSLEDGIVYRNGTPDDPEAKSDLRDHATCASRTLAPDEYFVLGDNRSVSIDSRVFGPLHADMILAKVLYRFDGGRGVAATAAEK